MIEEVIATLSSPTDEQDARLRREVLISTICESPSGSHESQQELLRLCQHYRWPVADIAVELLEKGVKFKHISADFTTGRVSRRVWPRVQNCLRAKKLWKKAAAKVKRKLEAKARQSKVNITTDAWVAGEEPKHPETVRFGTADEELLETVEITRSSTFATIGEVCVA